MTLRKLHFLVAITNIVLGNMSGFPGLPFRSVDQFNLSQTPVFPTASLSPLLTGLSGYQSGLVTSARSLYDPLLPLSPRISSPALPVGFARADLPYASSLLDPRNQLLRSPNYYLSPNASPLTFDQIYSQKDKDVTSLPYEARYRASTDLVSLPRLPAFAPEPHYKPFTGTDIARLSFPLELSPILDKDTRDISRFPTFLSPKYKSDHTDRIKDLKDENKVKPKLWKPFETDSPLKAGEKKKESNEKAEKILLKDKCNNNIDACPNNSSFEEKTVELESRSSVKRDHYPARPIPQYPSGIPKTPKTYSEKNTSFTTFQPWKNHPTVVIGPEPVKSLESVANSRLEEVCKVNECLSKSSKVENVVELETDCKNILLIKEIDKKEQALDSGNNNKTNDTSDVLLSDSERSLSGNLQCSTEKVDFLESRSDQCSSVIGKSLEPTEDSKNCASVSDQKNNKSKVNGIEENSETAQQISSVLKEEPRADQSEAKLVYESSIDKCESGSTNHNSDYDNVSLENNSEIDKEIAFKAQKDTSLEQKTDVTDEPVSDLNEEDLKEAEELDDGKVRPKSAGKQRRISEVCASLFSLSHVSTVSSTDTTKTADNTSADSHCAIYKSSTTETCKKKRRNSSVDKYPDHTDKTINARSVKDTGYRTDYNFNQISFEHPNSAMSGSCVQEFSPPASCQPNMRHSYAYGDNAVNYPPNMSGKTSQCFQDSIVQENAKTLPSHEAKPSDIDFKMSKHNQSKSLMNVSQEMSQNDSFSTRVTNQNEFKSSLQDNGSKYSPVRAPSSSGTGALSYGIFNTDSNSDSNFATSVSNTDTVSTDAEANVDTEVEPPFKWDYLHSKQFVDDIYKNQGCEFTGVVKSDIESLRDSDSPKTFLDLDTTTKTKPKININRSQGLCSSMDNMYNSMSDNQNFHRRQTSSPYYNQNTKGNSYDSQWGPQRANQNEYMSGDTGTAMKSDAFGSNHSNPNYNEDYQKFGQTTPSKGVNQFDSSKGYQGQYNSQPTSGSSYYSSNHQHSHDNFHGNNYNENSQYYDPNHQSSNQQYSSGATYSNSYQNMNQQYGNSNFRNHNASQNSNMPYQSNSHSPSSSQSYLPSNVESSEVECAGNLSGKKQYKKRGRKRKAEKEQELNEQALHRPNTIVQVSPNVGPLIHSENSSDSVDSFDYLNNPVETIFDYTYDESLPPIANQFLQLEQELCQRLLPLKYGHPVNVVYNPLIYSFHTHRDFVQKYCTSQRPILFLGMNPGPYGMSQNGVSYVIVKKIRRQYSGR